MRNRGLVLLMFFFSGCASSPIYNAPKNITVDDKNYVVCSGSIIVNKEGWGSEPTYDVSFTARYKWSETQYYEDDMYFRGVRRLEISESDIASDVCSARLTRHKEAR